MIPLKDDVPSHSLPVVTVALIGLNVLAFLYQLSLELDARGPGAGAAQAFVFEFGVVPCRLTQACPGALGRVVDDFPHPWVTIFTSMFLHGGMLHIGGNMLYLWIFGDNVEDTPATILTLVTFGFFIKFLHVPALIVLGFWIVLQLLNGYITVSAQSLGRAESGGVAWFAHIGGFLAGMLLLFLLRPRQNRRL